MKDFSNPSTACSEFKALFKKYYTRIFRHHFNYRTCRLEDVPIEVDSWLPHLRRLKAILNPVSCEGRRYRRRDLRRYITGETKHFTRARADVITAVSGHECENMLEFNSA